MTNDIYILPDYFIGNKKQETYIHFYSTDTSSVKSKVIFNQYLICFVLQGTKEVFSQNINVKVGNQQILLLESGSVLMSESLTINQKFESILLFFSPQFVSNFCMKHQIVLQSSDTQGYSTLTKNHFLENFQNSLLLLRNNGLKDMEQLKLEELLLYLYHNNTPEFLSFLGKATSTLSENTIRKVIATHLDSKLSIEELAFLCNMSVASFKRHFAAVFHTSPKKYLIENRMLKAQLLLQHNKTPSEIFPELGYESLSSFSNEFKKHVGLSPKQFQSKNELKDKIVEPLA